MPRVGNLAFEFVLDRGLAPEDRDAGAANNNTNRRPRLSKAYMTIMNVTAPTP